MTDEKREKKRKEKYFSIISDQKKKDQINNSFVIVEYIFFSWFSFKKNVQTKDNHIVRLILHVFWNFMRIKNTYKKNKKK